MAAEVDSEVPQETSYVFVRVLGRGSFGEAVLYTKTEDNSLVVWKEVNLSRLGEKERRDAQNEIDILSLLNHANIISYYNHFIDEDTLFIEMEYANGGSLYEKISSQTQLFKEEEVRWYLFQMASALAHIHQYSIIHRDIKTLNIFLTKSGLIKLGDFGISKVLEFTNQMAETLVGTPYYMSPELVKGEKYSYKSDIWALGCVLYEILTLTRTFKATNALKLACEIVRSEQENIDASYSPGMHQLVKEMLNKNAEKRPTAREVLNSSLFPDTKQLERRVYELNTRTRRERETAASVSDTIPVIKAKMSEVYQWGGGKRIPQKVEIFNKEKSPLSVCAGFSHFAVVTVEKELFTWTNGQGDVQIQGQLGHGDTAAYKAPKRVDRLIGLGVRQAMCGEDFTICLTDEGALYAFGSNYYGCLGCGMEEVEEELSPTPVAALASVPVQEISCGAAHVVALTREGDVYTWGCGEFGRLGLGSENDHDTPQKVAMPGRQPVRSLCAGVDGTLLVASSGRLLACGSNQYNKLGFNSQTSGLRRRKARGYDIPCKYTFSTVKPLSQLNVACMSAGRTHSAVVDMFGHLYVFGSNKFGQLGLGDFKPRMSAVRVGGVLAGRIVDKVSCGDGFTVVSTTDNLLFSWGNGKSGRLGGELTEAGKGPNNQCYALPRNIFGSLHALSCLSSCHWNTIIIAEKILNKKTLKTRASASKRIKKAESPVLDTGADITAEPDSAFSDGSEGEGGPDSTSYQAYQLSLDSGQPLSSPLPSPPDGQALHTTSQSLPSWLQAELEDPEVIPIPKSLKLHLSALGEQDEEAEEEAEDENQVEKLTPKPPDKDAIISELQLRIVELEAENARLKSDLGRAEGLI